MMKFNRHISFFFIAMLFFYSSGTVSATDPPSDEPTNSPVLEPTIIPTFDPSRLPTKDPTKSPVSEPSEVPSFDPSRLPTKDPTQKPSEAPQFSPTFVPTIIPSITPTLNPTMDPTMNPTNSPTQTGGPTQTPSTTHPSEPPTVIPSIEPTKAPSKCPSIVPSVYPTSRPSRQPSNQPTRQPSKQPSSIPSTHPTSQPSSQPSKQPQAFPSSKPSRQPVSRPSRQPSQQPSEQPTCQPASKPSGRPSLQPISHPSGQPSRQPSSHPSVQPAARPSTQPSKQPTCQPSSQPFTSPSRQPSTQPSGQPSSQPSSQPTNIPRCAPSTQPSAQPSGQPSRQPSSQPSEQPSRQPTGRPSMQPSAHPSQQPSTQPSARPSRQPSRRPTTQPSAQPSSQPSVQPVARPSAQPSGQPVMHPSARPSKQPSSQPSLQPASHPSAHPSCQPSGFPSKQPTGQPSCQPTNQPMSKPSSGPVSRPTNQPSDQPSGQPSRHPTSQPTRRPSTQPSCQPSKQPTSQPSKQPNSVPSSQPTEQPSGQPSAQPSGQPTDQPSTQPSDQPSGQPTKQPTGQPSRIPSTQPSRQPSQQPTSCPSHQPSNQPSVQPSSQPSIQPTVQPTKCPSSQPTGRPSNQPSRQPSSAPTTQPSCQPSVVPSSQPLCNPSSMPTSRPINRPSAQPTCQPSIQPSSQPSSFPSSQPSGQPNSHPSSVPSEQPSSRPSRQPSSHPTRQPSAQPSEQPLSQPSSRPTIQPSTQPSLQPSSQPSCQPSSQPSEQPSRRPSTQPSGQPTRRPSGQPSMRPSCQPSLMPSSQPSSTPTTEDSVRLFSCDSSLACETDDFGDCAFFSGNVVFLCVSETTPCFISAGNFTVGPNTNMTVNGTCELIIVAQHYITIHLNTTVKAPAVNFTANSAVRISGLIETSGLGPLYGASWMDLSGTADSPSVAVTGQGGSYGGSGGRNVCNNTYFVTTPFQLGTVDILSDLMLPYSFTSPTLGSGGAAPGGGRGGGRIVLSGAKEVYVGPYSLLSADGTEAQDEAIGAGSGGSITVVAGTYTNYGMLSVRGGVSRNQIGGSGGGGRISITISNPTVSSAEWNISLFRVHGGAAQQGFGFLDNPCLSGGAGTLYLRNGLATKDVTSLSVYNSNISTFASTLVAELPASLTLINAYEHAVLASLTNISMPQLSTCTPASSKSTAGVTGLCSYINLINATLVSISNASVVVSQVSGLPYLEVNNTSITGPFNSTLFTLTANIVNIQHSSLSSLTSLSSFGIQAQVLMLSEDSVIQFSDRLVLNIADGAELIGRIEQIPLAAVTSSASQVPYYFYSYMAVEVGGNLTLNNVLATNIAVKANKLVLKAGGSILPPSNLISACLSDVGSSMLTCTNSHYSGSMMYNNTYALSANVSITLKQDSLVQASALLLCAPVITIDAGSSANANSRGCHSGQGKGAGGFNQLYSPFGGGGGGFGGIGGSGIGTNTNGGASYSVSMLMFSGSGGSCFNGTCPLNIPTSRGGGIVTIVAPKVLYMYGNVTSNGMFGDSNDGGGSGGTVSVNARNLYGDGILLAQGGAGGNGLSPGGGGGGGYIQIYNAQSAYSGYVDFKGEIAAPGGAAGIVMSVVKTVEKESSQSDLLTLVDRRSALRMLSTTAATAGSSGAFVLPDCTPGYGNSQTTGQLCQLCAVGYYGLGNSSASCLKCTNAPTHSTYTDSGWTNHDCPFVCDTGRTTLNCYTPVQNFIFNVLTLAGLGACIAGFFVLVIAPLLFYRLRDKYGWFENKQMDMLGDVFKKANLLDLGFGDDSVINAKRIKSTGSGGDGRLEMRNNPVRSGGKSGKSSGIQDIQVKVMHARTLKDLRRVMRLADQDLPFHACRVNLLGSNHPWSSQGGAWVLPTSRPVCLRPMLLRAEYKAFAEDINASLSWNVFAVDMCFFFLVTCIAPPLSASVMNFIRKRRTAILLDKIANYDYSCFRCLKQRLARNSLRVGISPDSTIAFIDFLFDEDNFKPTMRPLCPIGQTRLPATFKLAGLGTYFSPFFVDTNDMILQAVPQTDVASSFIDEAWISFICELNTKLRTVQSDAIHLGILKLIHFLSDEKTSVKLGGLVVEFCTFSNLPQTFQSDLDAEEDAIAAAEAVEVSVDVEGTPEPPTGSPKASGIGRKTRSKTSTDSLYDRDSFVAATRARRNSFERHSENGNWFTQLGDALNIIGHGGVTSHRSHQTGGHQTGNRQQSLEAIEMQQTSTIRVTDIPSLEPRPTSDSISRPSTARSRGLKDKEPQAPPPKLGHGRVLMGGFKILQSLGSLLARGFQFCGRLLFPQSFRPEDPHGYELSFSEMCAAVQEGHLKLGILVTHPKVQSNTYIVRDDDYQSEDDDEANYSFDERPSNMSGPSERASSAYHSDEEEEDEETSTARGSSVQDFLRSPLASRESSHSIERAYGHKADEMAKFYKIMLAAEVNMTASSPTATADRPLFSPAPVSRSASRGSFGVVSPKSSFSERPLPVQPKEKGDRPPSVSQPPPAATTGKGGKHRAKSINRSSSRGALAIDISSRDARQQAASQYVDFRSVSNVRKQSEAPQYVEFGRDSRGSGGALDLDGHPLRNSGDRNSSNSLDADDDNDDVNGLDDEEDDEEEKYDEDETRARPSSVSRPSADRRGSALTGQSVRGSLSSPTRVRSPTITNRVESVKAAQSGRVESKSPPRTRSDASQSAPKFGRPERSSSVSKSRVTSISSEVGLALQPLSRSKKLKRVGGRRNLAKLHNLAPSAFQHFVNSWRWRSDDNEPVSLHGGDGLILNAIVTPPAVVKSALKKSISQSELSKTGKRGSSGVVNFENPAAIATSKSEKTFKTSNVNQRDSFLFEIEEPEGFRHTMSAKEGGSSYFKDSDMHYTANMMRNSTYNGRNSITGRNSIVGADDDRRSSLHGALPSISAGRGISRPPLNKKGSVTSLEMTSGTNKKKGATSLIPVKKGGPSRPSAVDIESLDDPAKGSSGWKMAQQPGTQIKKGFQYAYMNKLFLFYLSRFMFGSNVYPYGPSYVRKILEFIFFILCIADLALIAFILVDTYCVSGNATTCSDHQAWILILSVFPGAVLLAPMTGLVAMFLGPSGTLARIYALWSRLAGVNNVVILYFFLKYYRFFLASYGSIYPVLLLTSSRAFQCLFVDLYIAHVEKLRYTRGWDGLHTSLYKTKDNKKEMVL